jgi:hypothetical protein
LSAFLGFFFILGSFFDSGGAVAVFRTRSWHDIDLMGERVKRKYGRAEILAGTLRRGEFIGWCGGESSGKKLGGQAGRCYIR